jgi:hypothetical protein
MRKLLSAITVVVLTAPVLAQVTSRTEAPGGQSPPSTTTAAPADLNALLSRVEQAAQATNQDLARLRIEKWKTDGNSKRQLESNSELIQRNLNGTLPGMVSSVRTAPQSFAPSFRLYQNLGALNDVLAPLAESAGAFGPKGEYEQLARDANDLDTARRALGDRIYALAQNTDAELARLRAVEAAAKAAPPTPPKKVIVDDEAPAKPTAKKKKKPAAATQSASEPPKSSSPQ